MILLSEVSQTLPKGKADSLVVQWLGLCAFTAEGQGLTPGWGTKIPQAGKGIN